MLDKIIGCKLTKITKEEIIVWKDNKKYRLQIEDNEGDCCGYNEINTLLLIDENHHPIITDITYKHTEDYGDGDLLEITFYGDNKQLALLTSYSTSGSGWGYGACVKVKCKALKIDNTLTQW